jgi:hypothetical protein
MLFAVLAPLLAARMASATCESSLPSNIDAGMLQPTVIELLQRSATFRQQCRRVASAQVLRVTVRVSRYVEVGARGETVINRYEAGALRAEVTLGFGEDYQELLAHEFEHILEQVDGVDLRAEMASGRAWRTRSGAFETRRAFDAGVHARQEVDEVAAEAAHADGMKPPAVRHPFD